MQSCECVFDSRRRRSLVASSPGLAAVVLLAIGWSAGASSPLASQSADGSEQIIVGPVSVHGFQRNAPDDAGITVDAAQVNLAAVLDGLGEQATLWYQHVMTLSNPFFEGRAPGTAGNRYAADYIEFYFRSYGLEPAFPSEEEDAGEGEWTTYRQPFLPRNRENLATDNVGGALPGRGDLADQWVVIGAHYDHVGYGRGGQNADGALVYPGADDNASGTAGVLMLAQRFAAEYAEAPDDANLRSMLFMGFSAEEMGLVGSRHYVNHPTLSPDEIDIMINLDMIGRLREDKLLVQGVASAEGLLDRIRPHLLESGLTIYADPTGRGPSDHSSFYGAGIPVLFMFTGTHAVYHRPGDLGPTVNPRGASRIIDLTFEIAWDLATDVEPLTYTPVIIRRATLGATARPDNAEAKGLRVVRFSEDSPAREAGIQEGDLILAWNGEELTSFGDLRRRLAQSKPDQVITLTIDREGEELEISVTLGLREDR